MPQYALFASFVCFCALASPRCTAQTPDDSRELFFESRIRPILIEHCYECHSGTSTKGGLSLESIEGWKKGGDSGPAILPGNAEESLLIQAVRYADEALQMPPKGKLPTEAVDALTQWIEQGAIDPRKAEVKIAGMNAEAAKQWWAFQPLPSPTNNHFTPSQWIDEQIHQQLQTKGLSPAPEAQPRVLLRRLNYDLLGLPPTSQQVELFVSQWNQCTNESQRNEVLSNWVDELLSSPQYGVHWGRHWLDVVRYADTAGENTDRPLVHAWRYRNWVMDALNKDLPFSDFVRYQIAGDLILDSAPAQQRREGIIATGYLAIARRFGHDIDKDMHLTYEDVIDNVGRAFLGLSIGCARCHDHKYDPVTAEDYYALYGIFDSCRFSFPGCEPKGQPKDMVPLLAQNEIDELLAPYLAKKQRIDEANEKQRLDAESHRKLFAELASANPNLLAESNVAEGAQVPFEAKVTVRKGEVLLLSVSPNGNYGADTTKVQWAITETNSNTSSQDTPSTNPTSPSPQNTTKSWNVNELLNDLLSSNPKPSEHQANWCFLDTTANSFLVDRKPKVQGNDALSAWEAQAPPSVLVNTSEQSVPVWTNLPPKSVFIHPGPDHSVGIAWTCPVDAEIIITGSVSDAHPSGGDGVSFRLTHFPTPQIADALLQLGHASRPLEKTETMPSLPVAYAVAEANAKNAKLHLRGDPEKLGDEIPRRWLGIFGGERIIENNSSGRRELANWIANSPLTARVIVNRTWQWHFGRGIVPTPNDFGARGELPSHPQLLDQLTAEFVRSGYSLKALHRWIVLSNTYLRASQTPNEADPENRWLSHFSRRRLSAEEMRDSLLVASNSLDLNFPEQHPFPPESSWTFTQHDPFNAVYDSNHRAAFQMVQRQRRHPFLATFDGADPNGTTPARQSTTVPTQALFFMNDPFFHAQANQIATQLIASHSTIQGRTDALYRKLLHREATSSEIQRINEFLTKYPGAETQQWSAITRVLLASNEFLHVD